MLASLYAISYLSVYALAPFLFYWKDVGRWGWSLEATRDDEIQKRWSLTSRRRYSKYLSEKGGGKKNKKWGVRGWKHKTALFYYLFLFSFFLSSFFLLVLLNTFNTLRCLSRSKDTTAFTRPSSFTSRIQEYSKASRITWHKGVVSSYPRSYTLRIVSEYACRLAAVRHTLHELDTAFPKGPTV